MSKIASSQKSVKEELSTLAEKYPKSHEKLTVKCHTEEVIISFKGSFKHSITCSVPDEYPKQPPIWFSDSENEFIQQMLEDLQGPNNLALKSSLSKSVDHIIATLNEVFQLDISPLVTSQEENSSSSFESLKSDEMKDLSLSDDEDEEGETDEEFDDDDLNWAEEKDVKEKIDKDEGLTEEQSVAIEKISSKAAKKLGHFSRSSEASVAASDRLLKELRAIYKSDSLKDGKFSIEIVEDNIYEWKVVLHDFEPTSPLAKDLAKLSEIKKEKIGVELRFHFSADYPFAPPFVRVVAPVLYKGYTFPGGAMCMEMLTADGWCPAYSPETVCTQIAVSLVRGRGRVQEIIKKEFEKTAGKPADMSEEEYNGRRMLFVSSTLNRPKYTLEAARSDFRKISIMHKKHGWHPEKS